VKAFSGALRMRAIFVIIAACLVAGCLSATREREVHCLGAMMMDTLQAENEFKSAERAWRTAQEARFERSRAHRDSSVLSVSLANGYPSSGTVASDSLQGEGAGNQLQEVDEERTLYQRVVAAQSRHRETAVWYGRVAHRVQTRIEEDDMLYPVLGMLATSTGIVLYPLIRWNVRSVLWEGIDPDAEDDPVQVYCAARLGHENPGSHP
jgi:hypothetical protein